MFSSEVNAGYIHGERVAEWIFEHALRPFEPSAGFPRVGKKGALKREQTGCRSMPPAPRLSRCRTAGRQFFGWAALHRLREGQIERQVSVVR